MYQDPLLGEVLAASTYPFEIAEAQQWVQDHPKWKPSKLMKEAKKQNWEPSIQGLVAFPQVLARLSQGVGWTTSLGNAVLAQEADVMQAVQRMRVEAQAAGKLQSTPQETVTLERFLHSENWKNMDDLLFQPAEAEGESTKQTAGATDESVAEKSMEASPPEQPPPPEVRTDAATSGPIAGAGPGSEQQQSAPPPDNNSPSETTAETTQFSESEASANQPISINNEQFEVPSLEARREARRIADWQAVYDRHRGAGSIDAGRQEELLKDVRKWAMAELKVLQAQSTDEEALKQQVIRRAWDEFIGGSRRPSYFALGYSQFETAIWDEGWPSLADLAASTDMAAQQAAGAGGDEDVGFRSDASGGEIEAELESPDPEAEERAKIRTAWLDQRLAQHSEWTSDNDIAGGGGPVYNTVQRYRRGEKSTRGLYVRKQLAKAFKCDLKEVPS